VNKPITPSRARKSAFSGWIWIALTALIIGAAWFTYFQINIPNIEVFKAQRGTVVSAVYGTVEVEYDYTRSLRAENAGYVEFAEGISSGRISEGRPVQKGEILAKIIDEGTENRVRRSRINLDAAQERKKLGPPSQKTLETARDTQERLERLRQTTRTVAAAELERIKNEVSRLEKAVETERIEIDREINNLEEELDLLQSEADKNVLISPIDGIIKSVSVSDGDLVSDNTTVFELVREGMHVLGEVNEEDVGFLKPGMRTTVKLYSFPNREFIGKLDRILPTGDNQRYSVIVRLEDEPENLKAGMTGEMNIIIGERQDAVYIPTRSVVIDQALIVDEGIIRQRTVAIGYRNLEFSEITEGIDEGDLVVVEGQDLLNPGDRVRYSVVNEEKEAGSAP